MKIIVNVVDLLLFSMSLDKEKRKDIRYCINKYVEAHPELFKKQKEGENDS